MGGDPGVTTPEDELATEAMRAEILAWAEELKRLVRDGEPAELPVTED